MTSEGTLVTIEGRPALRFERRYPHPVARVWRAISDPAEMARWFPSDVEGARAVGAELTFVDDAQRAAGRAAGEPTRDDGPVLRGTVIAYDPPKVFSFTWGGEVLRFELLAEGSGTVLVFTQLLSHRSVAARNGSGWHMCLRALDDVLDIPTPGGDPGWSEIYGDYLRRLGPELGVPSGDGAMTWERSTHVEPDRVRTVTSEPAEVSAWGAGEHRSDPVRWDIEAADHGSLLRVTHEAIGSDAELAATWHALLVQLDMYLAAGQLVPVAPEQWVPAYERLI